MYPPNPDAAGAWLGIRTGSAPGTLDLVVEFRTGVANGVASFIIGRFNNGALEHPADAVQPDFATLTNALNNVLPLSLGGNAITVAAAPGGGLEITVFTETVSEPDIPALNGAYKLAFVVKDGQPVQYTVGSPLLGLTFPPDNLANTAADLIEPLLNFLFNAILSDAASPALGSVKALISIIKTAISGAPPSVNDLISAAASIAGTAGKLDIGDNFSLAIAPDGNLKPTLSIGPLAPGALGNAGISVGTLDFGATLALATPASPIAGFSVAINDVRLGQGGGVGATGLVAQLFPDLRDVQGFNIQVAYKAGDTLPTITGGGKIPIQRTIGPLEVVALLIEFSPGSFTVGVDLYFSLGPIKIVVYELGITISYSDAANLFLHGLGLSFDGGGIKLTGMFLEIPQGPGLPSDYIGAAVVSVIELFQLSAIGGYTKDTNGDASLFIFASLVAPLGGPPWFFITGIAGGFGFNRNLPSPELLGEHPFLKVMRGEITFNPDDPKGSIATLGSSFTVQHGQYWIAAGIQFTCFAVINGKVIVAVSFGKDFSFNLLGMLSYGISPIAYFELDFMVTVDADHFLLVAGMSPNSYIIDPAIFSLQGQFCMGVWYGGPHAADFVISIGGYHPFYKKPDYYPDLTRVGVKALVYNFIHVDIECFFACTPHALMAGASVSLYAKFAGIGAGLDVYIDVLIEWDPFFILAELGVTVWFEFCGRHEIGVDLRIYTPPFGGVATIHLFVVSFDISFGSSQPQLPPPPLSEFITGQLGAPATVFNKNGATMAALNSATAAGLFRIDVTDGRASKPAENSKVQEGISTPILVNSEFRFTVRTKLPIGEPGALTPVTPPSRLDGFTNVPLCRLVEVHSVLTVTAPSINQATQARMIDLFPPATFGVQLPSSQGGDARDTIAKIDTDQPSVPLSDGIEFTYTATFTPQNPTYLLDNNEQFSTGDEEYPLPLTWPRQDQQVFKLNKTATRFAGTPVKTSILPRTVQQTSRQKAAMLNAAVKTAPWAFTVSSGTIFRATVQVHPRTLTVAGITATTTLVSVPVSPTRRAEMFAINLKIAPVRAATPVRLVRPIGLTLVNNLQRLEVLVPSPLVNTANNLVDKLVAHLPGSTTTVPAGAGPQGPPLTPPATPPAPTLTIQPTKAGHIEVAGGLPGAVHHLTVVGDAVLRTIFFGSGGDLLEDRFTVGGQNSVAAPAGTRQMLFLHQGTLNPIIPPHPPVVVAVLPPPGIAENIGIESDTVIVALGPNAFAGHACVLRTGAPLHAAPALFDTLPGAQLLASATHFTVHFPLVQKAATLILIVEPITAKPGPALDQVRFVTFNATLTGLSTVVSPDRTAFLCVVDTTTPWQLECDLGPDWRFTSIVVTTVGARDMTAQLRAAQTWDLIDDRVQTGTTAPPINITFEVAK